MEFEFLDRRRLLDTDTDTDTDSPDVSDPVGHGDTDDHSDTDCDALTHGFGCAYADTDCFGSPNSDPHGISWRNTDDTDAYSRADSDSGRYAYTDPCGNPDPDRYSDPRGASGQPLDANAGSDWRSGRHRRFHHYRKRTEASSFAGDWAFLNTI